MHGLQTGLLLQLAIGPVFLYVTNLALQRTLLDGLIAVTAVTIVDYLYIFLSIAGIGKLVENVTIKKSVGVIGSFVLAIFGIIMVIGVVDRGISATAAITSKNLISSFATALVLTISNPLTILFFSGLFSAKTAEFNYTKSSLALFGLSVGLATIIFLGSSVLVFSLLRATIPDIVVKALNVIVGFVLVYYGIRRMITISKP